MKLLLWRNPLFLEMISPLRQPCPPLGAGRIAMPQHYLNGKFLPNNVNTAESQSGDATAAGQSPKERHNYNHNDFSRAEITECCAKEESDKTHEYVENKIFTNRKKSQDCSTSSGSIYLRLN